MVNLSAFRRTWPHLTADVQEEEKKDDTNGSLYDGSLDDEDERKVETSSPTSVPEILEQEPVSKEEVVVGVDLLDALENEYRCGLSQRVTERKSTQKEEEEEQQEDETEENSEEESVEKSEGDDEAEKTTSEQSTSPINVPTTPAGADVSPKSPTRSWTRMLATGAATLTREEALEMTVDKLRRQLEDMEEERDSLLIQVDTLEGKLDAQNAKIEALEYFFRRVNAREEKEHDEFNVESAHHRHERRSSGDDLSCTTSTSDTTASARSVPGRFVSNPTTTPCSVRASSEDDGHEEYQDEDDEAWELEAGPPKLSTSFQKTGEKMRSAKTRAAAKLATITFV